MFVESLLESYTPQSGRRRWTTLASFFLQALGIGLLVLLPLFYTEALPNFTSFRDVVTPPSSGPPSPPAQPEHRSRNSGTSEVSGVTVLAPNGMPKKAKILIDEVAPTPSCVGPCVIGSVPSGSNPYSAMDAILGPAHVVASPPPPPSQEKKRVAVSGGVMPGLLIRQVKPVYPPIAIQARIQGDVVLAAVISRDGVIENLRVVSGHPLLVRAAMDAVRQWRYRPYLLTGQPVEVETQIVVNFKLAG